MTATKSILLCDIVPDQFIESWTPLELAAFVRLFRWLQREDYPGRMSNELRELTSNGGVHAVECLKSCGAYARVTGPEWDWIWPRIQPAFTWYARQCRSDRESRGLAPATSRGRNPQVDRDGELIPESNPSPNPPAPSGRPYSPQPSPEEALRGSARGSAPSSARSEAARKAANARWGKRDAEPTSAYAEACEPHSAHGNRIFSASPHDAESAIAPSSALAPQRTTPQNQSFAPSGALFRPKPHSAHENRIFSASPPPQGAEESAGIRQAGVSAGARAPEPKAAVQGKGRGPSRFDVAWNEDLLRGARWPWSPTTEVPVQRLSDLATGPHSTPERISMILQRIEEMRQAAVKKHRPLPNPMALLIAGLGLQLDRPGEPWQVQQTWFEVWARNPLVEQRLKLRGESNRLEQIRMQAQQRAESTVERSRVV